MRVSEAFSVILPTNTVVATFMLAVEGGMGTYHKTNIVKLGIRLKSLATINNYPDNWFRRDKDRWANLHTN